MHDAASQVHLFIQTSRGVGLTSDDLDGINSKEMETFDTGVSSEPNGLGIFRDWSRLGQEGGQESHGFLAGSTNFRNRKVSSTSSLPPLILVIPSSSINTSLTFIYGFFSSAATRFNGDSSC